MWSVVEERERVLSEARSSLESKKVEVEALGAVLEERRAEIAGLTEKMDLSVSDTANPMEALEVLLSELRHEKEAIKTAAVEATRVAATQQEDLEAALLSAGQQSATLRASLDSTQA
uniref:Uncharacterized protein n=1 Tax=Chromera velia CCMP2878 TaxID=1169474 RepID=A0A0G4HQ40_9ALVE|eukprot:Cvel_30036.t1-p1 / transcript=Cvel_30036.t1 / gene=Cvel_30036 / organism=Chromera_velia_CCMP2878 / gene_product=hypothetical protein / transcript_product=hypothetical protein / location=Cvel_scaffold4220:8646-8993(+) / protein_length=116 / sequence_SO=supercontig / SO=protein_coding / is_pseudo=false